MQCVCACASVRYLSLEGMLKGDTLTYRVNAATTGGPGDVREVIWRRAE